MPAHTLCELLRCRHADGEGDEVQQVARGEGAIRTRTAVKSSLIGCESSPHGYFSHPPVGEWQGCQCGRLAPKYVQFRTVLSEACSGLAPSASQVRLLSTIENKDIGMMRSNPTGRTQLEDELR